MILQGTLEMLALRTLVEAPNHPGLVRMKRRGWITAEWPAIENNRRARYDEINLTGLMQLELEREEWKRTSTAVNRVLA